MRIVDFEWDEGNSLHLQLGHGIEPEEAEEVFANKPFFQKNKKGPLCSIWTDSRRKISYDYFRIETQRYRPSNNRLGYESS